MSQSGKHWQLRFAPCSDGVVDAQIRSLLNTRCALSAPAQRGMQSNSMLRGSLDLRRSLDRSAAAGSALHAPQSQRHGRRRVRCRVAFRRKSSSPTRLPVPFNETGFDMDAEAFSSQVSRGKKRKEGWRGGAHTACHCMLLHLWMC